MSKTKHTPGPWTVTSMTMLGDITGKIHELLVMPNSRYKNQHIAKCFDVKEIGRNGGLTIEEAKENAKLIAASPDLLKACENALLVINRIGDILNNMDAVQPEDDIYTMPLIESIHAAIKLATE